MSKPTKAVHEGKQVDADELEYKVVGAPEVAIQVEDGTTLKLLILPAKVIRLKDIYNPEGEPIYQLKWGTGVSASVPVNLLKPDEPTKASN
ncbi:MAG: hypothetical protein WA789_01820 [Candidatus Acidiferrum sp.]